MLDPDFQIIQIYRFTPRRNVGVDYPDIRIKFNYYPTLISTTMTRIKGGLLHAKRRRGILKHTKGFRWGRKSKIKLAKVAKMKAGQYAFDSRKTKKRINRGLWNIRLNAASRKLGVSYSQLIGALKKKNIALNRKVLSELGAKHPKIMAKIVESVR